jgi:cell division protein FtsB
MKVWTGIFTLWGLLLSGVSAGFVGSPGIIQAVRLNSLLHAKETQLMSLQEDLSRLKTEVTGLERSRVVQQREIRRVLGYAAPDEVIFDFTQNDAL